MYVFPVRCSGAEELKYIFPAKQREVQRAIDAAKSLKDIRKLIVFGSAVTLNCGINSDVDIAVDAPDIKTEDEFVKLIRPIKKALYSDSDIIHYNRIHNELLKNEIQKKGVDVYVNRI